jgi:hypothetical protein
MIAEFLRSLYTCAGRNLVFLRQIVGFVCREMETARGHFSEAAPAASQSLPQSAAPLFNRFSQPCEFGRCPMQASYSQAKPAIFFCPHAGLPLAMTARTILTPAVAIMIGPSLAFGSAACMTESEALAKFPKATHLYMRQNCWSNSAVAPVHSPRPPPHAAVPAPSARPALAVAPETVNSGTDAGVQCQYLPCE